MNFHKLRWNWHLPSKLEWVLLGLATIFLIILDYAQNTYQYPSSIFVGTIFGVTAIHLWWISFVLYVFLLVWLYVRAVYERGTHYKWDWLFGSLLIIGVMFILVGGLGAIYYEPEQGMSFFYGMAQITEYHFFGILPQLIGLGYFFMTE